MSTPDFSPQELSCITEVQKAPEAQKQSTFDRACQAVTNKARIALLAATLSLTPPALAQNTPNSNPNYQTFYIQIVERYPKLSPEQHQFFSTLYVKGLSVIDPKNEKIFGAYVRRIITATENKSIAMPIFNDMVEKGILPANHSYTKTLSQVTQEIDKVGQQNIAMLDKKIEQADQKIQQADQKIQQADQKIQQADQKIQQEKEKQQYYKQVQNFRSNMANKF